MRFVTSGWESGMDAGGRTPGRICIYIYKLCMCVFECLIVILLILFVSCSTPLCGVVYSCALLVSVEGIIPHLT